MTRRMTADLRIAVTPSLRERLEIEAKRRRRSLSNMARVLLEQGLIHSELTPDPTRKEFEILLEQAEVSRLERKGYELESLNGPQPANV